MSSEGPMQSAKSTSVEPLGRVALSELIKQFDEADNSAPSLYPSDFEVLCTFGNVELKVTLNRKEESDANWNTETWTGESTLNDLLSFGAAADGTGADQWYVPKALVNFEVSLRKIAIAVTCQTSKADKKRLNWSIVTTFFGNQPSEKFASAEPFLPPTHTEPIRVVTDPEARSEIAEAAFAVVGVGKSENKTKKWTGLSLQLPLRIATRKPSTNTDSAPTTSEVVKASLAVPVLTEVLKDPLGLSGLRLWYTREREDIPAAFVKAHRLAFGVDKNVKEPTSKDIKDGLMLQLAMKLGVTSHDYEVCLYGRGTNDAASKPPAGGGSGSLDKEDNKDVAGSEDVARKMISFRFLKLGITVDADNLVINPQFACEIGPLDVVISGLDIRLPVSASGRLSFGLRELGVSLKTPCLELRGALGRVATKDPDKDKEQYAGQFFMRLGVGKFYLTISAIGAYFVDHKANTKAFFLYAVLAIVKKTPAPSGPFQLTAIALGVGYNYELIVPDIDDLKEFPLIQAATEDNFLGTDPAPMSVFDKFKGSLTPMAGTHWGALGAEILVYGMIRGFALFILQGKEGKGITDIAILGIFQLQKEFNSKKRAQGLKAELKLVSLELVVKIYIALETEMVEIRARFTDNSYILDKNCKVKGGLAFCIWWGKSEHSGDWVFTIGGYHPRYQVPLHYPKEPRLGISFCPDPHVQLLGELYFAITPSAAMLGARAEFTFQCGPLAAWTSMWLDALIMWEPLYFELDIGVELGIRFTFWLFGEQTITLTRGLRLMLWGPDFGGFVEFKVLSFALKVSFGQKTQPTIYSSTFDAFVTKSLGGPPLSIPLEAGILHDFTSQTTRPADYVVEGAAAQLSVKTQVPVNTAAYFNQQKRELVWNDVVGVPECGNSKAEWTSALEVDVKDAAGKLANCFVATPIVEKVPMALWNPQGKTPAGLNEEEFVTNALGGFTLTPVAPATGRLTAMIDMADLVRNQPAFGWASITVESGYSQPGKPIEEMMGSITSSTVTTERNRLLAAMTRQGLSVPGTARLTGTASRAKDTLLASPRINPLGR